MIKSVFIDNKEDNRKFGRMIVGIICFIALAISGCNTKAGEEAEVANVELNEETVYNEETDDTVVESSQTSEENGLEENELEEDKSQEKESETNSLDNTLDDISTDVAQNPEEEQHEYVPNKTDGSYYTLMEDGIDPVVRTQQSGTCWTNSVSASIESTYMRENHEQLVLDASDMCMKIYDTNREEGWFAPQGNLLNLGGWNWLACEYLTTGYDGYILKYALDYDDDNTIEQMKEGIKKHGGISIAISDSKSRMGIYDGYKTLNDSNEDDIDHAVTIIGWDDNFPKEYFRRQPSENGAWLCQNSKSAAWGNNGRYWVSYESYFPEKTIFAVTNEYSEVLSYDSGNEDYIQTGDTTSVANVYHKKGTLAAIGTYTKGDNEQYHIEIYDENFDKMLSSVDASMDVGGYQIVELDEPIEVSDYAVVIRFDGPAPVEGAGYQWGDMRTEYKPASDNGQSYVLIDGSWEDMADEATQEKLGIDFAPNNACIKAIYK